MEDYEYRVIKLHAIQSQNISKLTGNISKNTGKFTSETNQIRLGGAMGGKKKKKPRRSIDTTMHRRKSVFGQDVSLGASE